MHCMSQKVLQLMPPTSRAEQEAPEAKATKHGPILTEVAQHQTRAAQLCRYFCYPCGAARPSAKHHPRQRMLNQLLQLMLP